MQRENTVSRDLMKEARDSHMVFLLLQNFPLVSHVVGIGYMCKEAVGGN